MADINVRKTAILEALVAAVRRVISADKSVVDQIIFAQAKALGVNPPDGLNIPADVNKAA
jgi:hypothetical protein